MGAVDCVRNVRLTIFIFMPNIIRSGAIGCGNKPVWNNQRLWYDFFVFFLTLWRPTICMKCRDCWSFFITDQKKDKNTFPCVDCGEHVAEQRNQSQTQRGGMFLTKSQDALHPCMGTRIQIRELSWECYMDCETYGVICTSRICDGYAKSHGIRCDAHDYTDCEWKDFYGKSGENGDVETWLCIIDFTNACSELRTMKGFRVLKWMQSENKRR